MTEDVSRLALQRIQVIVQGALSGKLPEEGGSAPNLLDVPYRSQLEPGAEKYNNDCGAAAAVMLIEAYTGKRISVTEFYEQTGAAGDVYLNGTQIIRALDRNGVTAHWSQSAGMHGLFDNLTSGKPAILLINYKRLQEAIETESHFTGPHFAVAVGLDIKNVYIHDPLWRGTGGEALPVPIRLFDGVWETTPGNSVRYGAIVPAEALGGQAEEGFQVLVTAYVLNVRTGPGTNNPLNGDGLLKGQIVTVYEQQGDWGRIGTKRWIHLGYTQKL